MQSQGVEVLHDNIDPSFGNDARNIHFALAADGVNPFKQTRSTWSMWPVTLLNYNLLPWLCTKFFFVLLALLIPGKESQGVQLAQASPRFQKRNINYNNQNTLVDNSCGKLKHLSSDPGDHKVTC
jgi:hypothetical protein